METLATALASPPVKKMLKDEIDAQVRSQLGKLGPVRGSVPSSAVQESTRAVIGRLQAAGDVETRWQSLCAGQAPTGPENGLGIVESSASGSVALPVKASDSDDVILDRILARERGVDRPDGADRQTRAGKALEALQQAPANEGPVVDHVSGRVLEADARQVADVPAEGRGLREQLLMKGLDAVTVTAMFGGDAA